MAETISQTIRVQAGKITVEIINQTARQTKIRTTHGARQRILRHGVTCRLPRARVVMRIIAQTTLEDGITAEATIVEETGMEVVDLEETTDGAEEAKVLGEAAEAGTTTRHGGLRL
jgi:hypothetical protein